MNNYKIKFKNGRTTTICCSSNEELKSDLIDCTKRFNSEIATINDMPTEKLSVGGFLVGTFLGGVLGNAVAKSGVKKTAKTISKTTKKTISKTRKGVSEFRTASSKSKKFSGGGLGKPTYIPNEDIENIKTNYGQTISGRKLLDGAYATGKVKKPTMSRTQFEDESFEYATGGKIGDDIYAYFAHNYMGYQLVESAVMGEVYDGKIIDVITENNTKKYVLKFENGETKKLSQSMFNDYIYTNKKFVKGGGISSWDTLTIEKIGKKFPYKLDALNKILNTAGGKRLAQTYDFRLDSQSHKYDTFATFVYVASIILNDSGSDSVTPSGTYFSKKSLPIRFYLGLTTRKDGNTTPITIRASKDVAGGMANYQSDEVNSLYDIEQYISSILRSNPPNNLKNMTYAKGGGTKQKQKINKKYSHFAVSKEDGKIVDAWETLDDIETLKHYANLDLKDNDHNPRDFNILSGKTLIKRGINPYDSDNWGHFSTRATRYEDGGNIGSMAMAGAMPELAIANEVSKKLPETTSAVDKRIAERIYSDKPSFWEDRGLKHYAGGGGVGQNLKIKDWYTKYRPEDDLGFKLNPNSTFKDLLNAILNGNDVYEVLGVRDSVIRERSFQKLSIIEKKEGQWAYNNWLIYSKNYGKGGNVLATSPTLDGINKLISEYLYGSTITLVPVDSEKKSFEVHNKKGKTQFLVVLNKNKYQFIPSQQYAQGGSVGQQITFKHWSGDTKNGTITEDLGNGDFQVSSGFGNVLVNKEDIISSGTKSPERKKMFGFFKEGGGVDHYELQNLKNQESVLEKRLLQVVDNQSDGWRIDKAELESELEMVRNQIQKKKFVKGGGVGGSNVGDLILIKCDSSMGGKVTFVVSEAELNKIPETSKSSLTEKAKEFVYEMSEKSNTYNVQYNFQRNVQYYFQKIVTNKILVYKYLKGYNHTEYKITPSPSKDGSFSISTGTYHKFAGGGSTNEGIDLFEDYENIPPEVKAILDKYSEDFEDGNYQGMDNAHDELEEIGYTFDFYLDGVAYDLRPLGTKGKVEE